MRKFKYLKTYLITGLIFLVVGIAIFLAFFFLKGQGVTGAIDGTTFAAIILGGIGVLMLCGHFGAFDGFAFGFKQLSYKFKKVIAELPQYHEYIAQKSEKRSNSPRFFIPVLIVSVIFLVAFLILEIIYQVNFA